MIQVKRPDANLVATHLVAVVRLNSLIRCGIKEHTRNRMRLVTKLCILVLDVSENLIQIARVQCVDIVLPLRRMRIVFGVNDENRIILGQHDVALHYRQHCPNNALRWTRWAAAEYGGSGVPASGLQTGGLCASPGCKQTD